MQLYRSSPPGSAINLTNLPPLVAETVFSADLAWSLLDLVLKTPFWLSKAPVLTL